MHECDDQEYMYMSRKTKKYVCLYVCGGQVQPMLKSVEGCERTMPGVNKQLEVSEGIQHDYGRTGGDLGGSVIIE